MRISAGQSLSNSDCGSASRRCGVLSWPITGLDRPCMTLLARAIEAGISMVGLWVESEERNLTQFPLCPACAFGASRDSPFVLQEPPLALDAAAITGE